MSSLVLALGDSLTAGYGLAPQESFAAQLEALLRVRDPGARVINAGVSGDTSAGGRARLPRHLSALPRRPDLAIVELGANDFLRGLPVEQLRANLDAILVELARCGVPALLAGMAAPAFLGPRAAAFGRVFPELAARHGVPLYPHFLEGVAGLHGLTLADGIHPNARAVGIVARRILPHVEAALAAKISAAA
jgi:acyl-CoA thioesterase I